MMPRYLVSAALGLLAVSAACRGTVRLERVSATEFVSFAREIERTNSASWVSYIGVSDSRAYLEYGTAVSSGGGARTIVYWTELEGLPPELATRLQDGDVPWQAALPTPGPR